MVNLQDIYTQAGKYSCLCQCYLYAVIDKAGVKEDLVPLVLNQAILNAYLENTDIDNEFFVKNPVSLMNKMSSVVSNSELTFNVIKKDITSVKDLPMVGYAAVRFDFNGHSHWVLFKNQVLLYNSLSDSQCFKYGKPTTARIIEIKKGGKEC